MSADRTSWKPLPATMAKAIAKYDAWSHQHLLELDASNQISAPLFHYTDAAGLTGIISNQEVWFTSYAHLNDPTEIHYGMSLAIELLTEIGEASDPRIKMFCEMVKDLFTHDNLNSAFGFFIASFSKAEDDLGQWRGYGDNGRGYSLGLAPHLFHATAGVKANPTENFVVLPVVYGKAKGRQHLMPAIERAIRIVGDIISSEAVLMSDVNIGMPFFDTMAKALIASEMILNSFTIKHEAYEHEKEIRLVIVGQHKNLASHISTRVRRGDIVPYIKGKLPIQAKDSIADIVIGPSASASADDGVRVLLQPFHDAPESIIRRSTIPYRAT